MKNENYQSKIDSKEKNLVTSKSPFQIYPGLETLIRPLIASLN